MESTTIEFAVDMTCDSCVELVKNNLAGVSGIENVQINLEKKQVVIQSKLSTLQLLKILESTGKKVAVKGYAGSQAAVSILEAGNSNINGVIRFIQATPNTCIIDGTVDGLNAGLYHIFIHECGDISAGCDNVGNVFNPEGTPIGRTYGDLGEIQSDSSMRAEFRLENGIVKVSEIIGRAFVISNKSEDKRNWKKLVCGVIARSAGLFQNPKSICACDGTTIWDEVVKAKSTL
nr:copper chaperone for superoxide dismutase isoform X2 [Leptinotarsa decemlineata]